VSGWILGYAIFGLVVFLLSYPLWENQRNYRSVFKIFYILLFPLLIVMLGALWVRLSAYGFTVNRLLVFLLGVWFVPISILNLYFLVKKQRGKIIIFVPFSLIVTLLLFSLGPWSIFNLSRQNQFQRLEGLLRKNNILVDGEIKKSNQTVASKDIAEIESVFRYLSKTHGLQNQRVWLDKWIKTIPSEENFFEKSSWGQTHLTMRQLGLNQSFPAWFIFKTDANSFTTAGYDYVLLISQYNDQEIRSFLINQKEYKLVPDLNNSKIQITKENQLIFKIDLLQKITQLAQITKTNNLQEIILPPDDLTFEISNKYGAMKLCVSQLEIRINDEQKMELTNFEGLVLLKLKV
jgi:hypothetical protein